MVESYEDPCLVDDARRSSMREGRQEVLELTMINEFPRSANTLLELISVLEMILLALIDTLDGSVKGVSSCGSASLLTRDKAVYEPVEDNDGTLSLTELPRC